HFDQDRQVYSYSTYFLRIPVVQMGGALVSPPGVKSDPTPGVSSDPTPGVKSGDSTSRGKDREKGHPPNPPKGGQYSEACHRIFEAWKEATGRRGSIDVTVKGRGRTAVTRGDLIERRLREGKFSEEDLTAAVRGVVLSPHHMGRNETGTKYDNLDVIL